MGGYGAVKLGLKHHEMFASVNSHSGPLGFLRDDPDKRRSSAPSSPRIFGDDPEGGPEDPFAIVEKHRPRPHPRDADRLRHRGLPARPEPGFHKPIWNDLHVPHEYEEFPGGHDWAYWDEHVQRGHRVPRQEPELK